MAKKEYPEDGQEAEIKYKITNSKGEILDQTIGRQSFKFIVGDTQNIMKSISDAVKTMKFDEKKTIEINSEEDSNIIDLLGEEKKNLPENKILKVDLELVRFGNVTRSIYELTDDEKFEHAKNVKSQFVIEYAKKDYKKALELIKEGVGVMEKINKVNLNEEMKKYLVSLLLNQCNCLNNLKDYSETVKIGKKVVEMSPSSVKAYYYLGNAYAYLDEYSDATKCYDKLYELMDNKEDPGVVALNKLITSRRTLKEENAKRRFRAFLANKDK